MNKVFVDSNLWLYAFIEGQDTTKHIKAKLLLQNSQDTIILSNQVISEVSVNLLRKAKIDENYLQSINLSFANLLSLNKFPILSNYSGECCVIFFVVFSIILYFFNSKYIHFLYFSNDLFHLLCERGVWQNNI